MKILCTIAAYMLTVTLTFGQTVSKEKKLSGRFAASKGKLTIDNSYGKLTINTWDRSEITVDITITAKAVSAGDAQELLNRVAISEPQNNGTGIFYKTVITKENRSISNSEFHVDYIVNMPARHTAEFANRYGDIRISDIEGKLSINLEYGDLTTANIRGNDNDIKISYGSASIAYLEGGDIKASYSRLSITKAGSINVSNQFETTTIATVRNLDVDQKYGNLKIGAVEQLKGSTQYADLSVDKLMKSVQMKLSHCGNAKFDYVGPSVGTININSSFSNLSYHFDKNASLSGNIMVSFGNVSNEVNNILLITSGRSNAGAASYKAKIGNGNGNLDVKASYGNVLFK